MGQKMHGIFTISDNASEFPSQHGSDRLCEGNHRKGDHGIPEVNQISHLLVQVECGNQRVRRRVDS